MKEHSLEAGRTLNLLYEINRIADLRYNCDAMQGKLYAVFIEDFLRHVKSLQTAGQVSEAGPLTPADDNCHDSGYYNEAATNTDGPSPTDNILNNLTTQDDFLIMAFALNTSQEDLTDHKDSDEHREQSAIISARTIYDELQKSNYFLPLEEVIVNSLTRILKIRIAFANSFVMRLYREEFAILKHLQNIRRVLLMEASDLMYQFYEKLFQQVS